MSELAVIREAQPAPYFTPPPDPTGGRLVAWAAGMLAAHQIGTALSGTTFAPKEFRGKPDDAAAAILYGDEIGLTPTQSLQSIFVIGGKPSLYARAMVAVVMAAGHEVWTVSKSDTEVTVSGRRRGSSHVTTEKWTIARATKAGYVNNAKYKTDPAAMLYARAASDVCRQIAPDALAGIAYSVEELELADEPKETLTRAPRKVSRAKVEQLEPEFDPEPENVTEAVELISEPQMNNMFRLLNLFGLTEREDIHTLVSEVVGEPIESSKDLTKDQASKVISYLMREVGEVLEPGEPS